MQIRTPTEWSPNVWTWAKLPPKPQCHYIWDLTTPPNNITFFQCIRSKKVASMNSTGDLPFKCGFFKEKALHSEHVGLSIKVRLVLWSLNVQKREVTSYGRMGRRVGTISKLDFYLGVVIPRGHSRVWIFGFYVLSSLPGSKQALSGPRYGSKGSKQRKCRKWWGGSPVGKCHSEPDRLSSALTSVAEESSCGSSDFLICQNQRGSTLLGCPEG